MHQRRPVHCFCSLELQQGLNFASFRHFQRPPNKEWYLFWTGDGAVPTRGDNSWQYLLSVIVVECGEDARECRRPSDHPYLLLLSLRCAQDALPRSHSRLMERRDWAREPSLYRHQTQLTTPAQNQGWGKREGERGREDKVEIQTPVDAWKSRERSITSVLCRPS